MTAHWQKKEPWLGIQDSWYPKVEIWDGTRFSEKRHGFGILHKNGPACQLGVPTAKQLLIHTLLLPLLILVGLKLTLSIMNTTSNFHIFQNWCKGIHKTKPL